MIRPLPSVTVAAVLLAGCAGPAAEEIAVAPATALLQEFDPGGGTLEARFAQLNLLASDEPGVAAGAAAPLVTAPREHTRYAAIYVLGLTARSPDDIAALRAALDDEVSHHRLMAAGSLIGLGEREAIPVLIEFVNSPSMIPYSSKRMADLALPALEAHTDQAHDDDRDAWMTWWERDGERLAWDAQAGRFEP